MKPEEAINQIEEFMVIDDWSLVYLPDLHDALEMAIEALKEQRPHGEWIETYYSIDGVGASRFKCSKCEYEISTYGKPYNFCPNCGADMRKEGGEK